MATYEEHSKWVNDTGASTINLINYGVNFSRGLKLATPFQAVGIVVTTEMMKWFIRLQQAIIDEKYLFC